MTFTPLQLVIKSNRYAVLKGHASNYSLSRFWQVRSRYIPTPELDTSSSSSPSSSIRRQSVLLSPTLKSSTPYTSRCACCLLLYQFHSFCQVLVFDSVYLLIPFLLCCPDQFSYILCSYIVCVIHALASDSYVITDDDFHLRSD